MKTTSGAIIIISLNLFLIDRIMVAMVTLTTLKQHNREI